MKCSSPLPVRFSKVIHEEALMKLSNEDLVKHLAAVMQTDEDEATKKLSQWVLHIILELDQHGSCSLEGLGVLVRSADTIEFVPEERLAVEINYRYAGMQPQELAPGRPGEVSAPYPNPSGLVERVSTERELPAVEKEEVELSADETGETSNQKPVHSEADSFEKTALADPESKPAAVSKKPRTSILLKLIPVAAVLVVAFLLYVHFDGQRLDQNNLGSLSEQQQTLSDVPLPAPGEAANQTSIGPQGSFSVVEPEHDPNDTPAATEVPGEGTTDGYGLYGSVHSAVSGAYSIVVYSLSNADRARNERNRLEEQGFRALLWMATTADGSTTWRVGAGQFRSVADALEATNQLPEPYKSNHFIIRIQ